MIVLGDFNDVIVSPVPEDNVFYNFSIDRLNYAFTDLEIAQGDPERWSYPNWPSHIDHILITNELFENQVFTQTLTYDFCDSSYLSQVSDHRPLMIQLKQDQ